MGQPPQHALMLLATQLSYTAYSQFSSALGVPTVHTYSPQWTLFHASRSLTSPTGSGGGGSWPSLYSRTALPQSTLARSSGVRCPRSCALNRVAPGQMQALCG